MTLFITRHAEMRKLRALEETLEVEVEKQRSINSLLIASLDELCTLVSHLEQCAIKQDSPEV